MRRFWTAIATLCSLLLPALLLAQPVAPGAAPDLTAADENNWHLLIDQSGELTLDDVLEQRQLLQRLEQRSFTAPGGDRAVWLQIAVPPQETPRWLWLTAPRVAYLDYYLLQDGKIQRQVETGERRPAGSRSLATLPYLFNLPGDGKPREVFVRLQSDQPLITRFQVMDESGFLRLEGNAYLYGALLGILLLLGLYNLKGPATGRRIGQGALGLLQLALWLSAAANMGLLSAWLPGLLYSQSLLADLAGLAAGMLLLGVVLRVLDIPRARADGWLLRGGLWVLGLQMLAMLISESLRHSLLVYGMASSAMLLATAVAGIHWRRDHPAARLLMLGALTLLIGFVWFLLILAGVQTLPLDCPVCPILWASPLAGLMLTAALGALPLPAPNVPAEEPSPPAPSSAELRGRSDFLARISHEIRAPLNGVLGMTELLFTTPLSTKQRDYVQTIRTSGNELLNLINELLDIPRLHAGGIELEEVQFNVPALVADALDIFRARAEQQDVELISFIQPQVPQTLCGDPTRLRQILLNLLDNALKHTDGGEVLLGLRVQDGPEPRLHITVEDSAQPLPAAEREALLGTALDHPDVLANSVGGARIGLLIARHLVELMRGRFGIASGEPRGNTLWIDLPMREQGLPVGELDDSEEQDASLRGLRLLIVDDNETCRKVLLQQCASWGMAVTAAASGKEALALLRTKAHLDEFYDAVLLDQEMPGMTGLQLALRIKEDLNLKHDLLLIMLTGITHAPSKVVARNAGIKRILTKPVAGYTLQTTLAEELGRRSPPADPHVSLETPEPGIPVGFRILVAEDDPTSTKVMRGMLNKLDLQPDMVVNGVEALAAIKATRYDLVLMDCEMPVMDGYTATRQLREWEAAEGRPRTPVVALTAHVFSEHRERAHGAGMDGHMSKPVELSELRELVQHWARAQRRDSIA